jgi:hypothetical protein
VDSDFAILGDDPPLAQARWRKKPAITRRLMLGLP